jgi:hypothetical protein
VLLELLAAEPVLVAPDASLLELAPPALALDETLELELVGDWPPAPAVAELEELSPWTPGPAGTFWLSPHPSVSAIGARQNKNEILRIGTTAFRKPERGRCCHQGSDGDRL